MTRCYAYLFLLMTLCCGIFWASYGYAVNTNTVFPEKWVYDAMETLYHEGYIQNYPSNWVKSGNNLTRYEIAFYIKNLITEEISNANIPVLVVDTLQRLIVEFSKELANLGINATDIRKVSPTLAPTSVEDDGYVDLGQILKDPQLDNDIFQAPSYYFGQYYQSFERKSFIFIPMMSVKPEDFSILDGNIDGINIVYQPSLEDYSFLVIKGELPSTNNQSVSGYYLFPIEHSLSRGNLFDQGLNDSVFSLLDEVNQIQQIDNLWGFDGSVSLTGYVKRETDFQTKMLIGNVNHGLKIGGLFIYSDESQKTKFELNNFGLPFANSFQNPNSGFDDLDQLSEKTLESIQINIQGSKNLNNQVSLHGGLDLLYRSSETDPLFKSIWPSDTKASAGLNYQMNENFTLLTYQSIVNSQNQSGLWSTTSIGVQYDNWVTLWLAYQLLDFEDPVVTGAVMFRF